MRVHLVATALALSLAACGAGPSPQPAATGQPLRLRITDTKTGKDRLWMEVAPDGTVSSLPGFGECVGAVRGDQVTLRSGQPLLTRAPDGTLKGADRLRLLDDGELRAGDVGVTVDDRGAVSGSLLGPGYAARFEGFTPERRRTAMLALAGWHQWFKGCLSMVVVEGLAAAYGREANPEGKPTPEAPGGRCGCPALGSPRGAP